MRRHAAGLVATLVCTGVTFAAWPALAAAAPRSAFLSMAGVYVGLRMVLWALHAAVRHAVAGASGRSKPSSRGPS